MCIKYIIIVLLPIGTLLMESWNTSEKRYICSKLVIVIKLVDHPYHEKTTMITLPESCSYNSIIYNICVI